MKALEPLVRILLRSLRTQLLRRLIVWLAYALLALVLGNLLARFAGDGRVLRLGLYMTVLSGLPVCLLWPPSEKRLTERLRGLDEEMVFEAYLEAGPGPVKDILRRLAAERAAALPFRELPREPLLAGLGGLCGAAIAAVVLMEAGSFLILGHSLTLSPERPVATGSGVRIEERGFSDFATEDPAARRIRREKALDKAAERGANPLLGTPGQSAQRFSGQGAQPEATATARSAAQEALAKRKQGEREEGQATAGSSSSGPTAEGNRKQVASGPNPATSPSPSAQVPGQGSSTAPPTPSPTGQGYEHTGDTRIPSPLLDYRSRFESRYAERTGQHVAASSRLGFGELRDFQRRYFDSFTLRADVGAPEDPYAALLKRRWAELKGGDW